MLDMGVNESAPICQELVTNSLVTLDEEENEILLGSMIILTTFLLFNITI